MNESKPRNNNRGENNPELVCAFYQHLAASSADSSPPIFVVDPDDDFRLVFASTACRELGNAYNVPQDICLPEYIPTLTHHQLQQLWHRITQSGRYSLETDYRLATGPRVAVEIVFGVFEYGGRNLMSGYMRDISERRALEAERSRLAGDISRQETELRYREIFENVTDGIFLLDIDGERFRFSTINPALARITGIVPMEVIGRSIEEAFPENTAQTLISHYRRCVEEGSPIQLEVELELPAGRKFIESTLVPVKDGFGRIHRIIGLTSDITQRKAAEREINFLAYSLDHMQDAVFVIDAQMHFRYVNQKACQSLGYSLQELLSMRIPDIDPYAAEEEIQTRAQLLTRIGSMSFETFHQTKDGRIFPVEINVSAFNYDGEWRRLAVARDITERKRHEALIQERLELEQRFSRMAEHLPGFVFTFRRSPDGYSSFPYISAGVRDVYGLAPEAIIEDMGPLYAMVHADDRQAIEDAMEKSIATLTPFSIEFRIHYPANGTRWLEAKSQPVVELDGSVLCHGMMLDITERKRMENEMRQQTEFQGILLDAMSDVGMQVMMIENGRIIFAGNRKLAHEFGYDATALGDGPLLMDIIHPDDQAWVMDYYRRRAAGEVMPTSYELSLVTRSGERREFETAVAIVPGGAAFRIVTVGKDVTERKRMEAALRDRERDFRSLAENLPDNVVRWDNQGRYVFVNPTNERTIGVSSEEVSGKRLGEAFPDGRFAVLEAAIDQVIASGEPALFVRQLVPAENGEMHIHDINLVPEFDETGCIASVLGIGRNMTDIYRMQETIAAREQEFRSLAEGSPDSIIRYDIDHRIRYINSGLIERLGLNNPEDVLGKLPIEAWPDGRYSAISAAADEAIKTEQMITVELIVPIENGSPLYHQIHVAPERDVSGKIIGTIAFGRDITSIRETEQQLHHIIQNLPGLAYTLRQSPDGQSSIPFASIGIEEFYGVSADDVKNDLSLIHALTHPDDLLSIEAAISKSAHAMVPFRGESRICRPGLPERWVEVRSVPTREADGSILWYGIMLDITERKRIDHALQFIAQRGWKEGGESFLTALARYLGQTLQVDYVIFDKLAEDPNIAETVAIYARGEVLPNMQYGLAGTPCDNVMDGKLCCYPSDVQKQFPQDTLLVDMQVESYVGLPLLDSGDRVIGLIAVLDGKPMPDTSAITSLLQLVGPRAAAELEREQSEQTLAESRKFLDRIIDTIADPIFVKDREHRWIKLNRSFCNFIGHPMEHLLGKSDYDFFPMHEAEVFWEKDEAVFNSGEESINEEVITDHDGFIHTILTKKTCYTDERGQQFLVGIILDITERKQHELALLKRAQLEEQLSSLAASVPGFIFTIRTDMDRRVSFPFVSAGVEDLFGLNPEDVRDDAAVLRSRYHPDDLRRVLLHMDESERNLSPFRIEIRVSHPQRGQRWIEIRSTPHRQSDGSTEWHGLMIDITERKQAQHHLEVTQQRLHTVLQTIPDYVWLKDMHGVFLACNEALERLYGTEAANIVGKTDYDFVDASTADFSRRKDKEALQAGRVLVNEEWVTEAGNNQRILLETRKVPVYDSMGKVMGVLGIGRDITEKKLRDEQLTLLDYTLDHVAEALYLIDENARFIRVNAAACRMLGYSIAELLSMSIFDIDPNFDYEQWISTYQDSHFYPRLLERCHRRKDGTVFPVEIGVNYTFFNEQRYHFTLVRDITERKQAEELLHQREREFRTLVENLPTYVVRLDRDLRRMYVNPAYIKLVDTPESELVGSHISKFWRITNIATEEYAALLLRVLETGVETEVSLEWKDVSGHLFTHLVRVAPEYSSSGEAEGLLILGFDITEHKREQVLETERQRVFEMMAQGEALDQTLDQIARYVESAQTGRHCFISLLSETSHYSTGIASLSSPCPEEPQALVACVAHGRCVGSSTEGETQEHACDQTDSPCCRHSSRKEGLTPIWSAPIIASSGQALGLMTLFQEEAADPDTETLALLRQACQLSAIAIERKRLEEQMHHQASYDTLTGLPNRRLFSHTLQDEIANADRNGDHLALLFIDLDRFKEVNDTLGHHIGDRLLVEAARRIQKCVRVSDTVARLGGDEFVVTLPKYVDAAQLGRVAHQIIETMSVPFHLDEQQAYVSASIGIACYPADADSMEVLVSRADQAMYSAKAQGRNCFGFFTATMQQQAQHRMRLMLDLRNALSAGQLDVHYQPIVDAATGRVVKAEALVRWHHPVLGAVRPDQFIPMAEEAGVIHDIGDWIFRQSAAMVVRWKQIRQAGNHEHIPCQVSVNMSPRQFVKGHADEVWIDYLREIDVNPACMSIEITEGLLLDDRVDVMTRLSRFREAGMGVALDDFGTGYSAMAYLKKFNIDYLKIDRSFVRDLESDPNDRAIAEAIIVMAHKLGLQTIAEGVETVEQRDLLAAAGCEFIQGYLYAQPMAADKFLEFVSDSDAKYPSINASLEE